MRIRTAAVAVLAAGLLTGCSSSDDDPKPAAASSAPAVDPRDLCLAHLVRSYPSLDDDAPLVDQVPECRDLNAKQQGQVLEWLSEYDSAMAS
ncbi:hypothetical protein [Streptomyces sp. 049-1]|uniref:hypothetical protein n=1 Tax=Streptomyces sp. 049-1 TaxID=2789264 RepID=UPI0039805A71